jgi:predicted ATPase
MLSLMNSMNLITFNYEEKEWQWDLQKIAAMNIPEDVVDFLLEELDNRSHHAYISKSLVPIKTRDVLRVAACLGGSNINLSLLSRVMTLNRVEIAHHLLQAEEIGLISSDQSYQVNY